MLLRSCTISCSGDRLSLFGRRMAQQRALQSTRGLRTEPVDPVVPTQSFPRRPNGVPRRTFFGGPTAKDAGYQRHMGTGVASAKAAWLFGGRRARTGGENRRASLTLVPTAALSDTITGCAQPIAGWQFGWADGAASLPSQDGKT